MKNVQVKLSDEEYQALTEIARKEKRSLAGILRWLIYRATQEFDSERQERLK